MRKTIRTTQAPEAIGPYSQAVLGGIQGTGLVYPGLQFIFVSGQIPLDPATGQIVGTNTAEQTEQVMKNLAAILAEAGTSIERAVKLTVYLTDLSEFPQMNEVYAKFVDPKSPPARATVQVAALPKGAKVEIDAIAVV